MKHPYRGGFAEPLGASYTHTDTHFNLYSCRYRECFIDPPYRWDFSILLYKGASQHAVNRDFGSPVQTVLCEPPHGEGFAKAQYRGVFANLYISGLVLRGSCD